MSGPRPSFEMAFRLLHGEPLSALSSGREQADSRVNHHVLEAHQVWFHLTCAFLCPWNMALSPWTLASSVPGADLGVSVERMINWILSKEHWWGSPQGKLHWGLGWGGLSVTVSGCKSLPRYLLKLCSYVATSTLPILSAGDVLSWTPSEHLPGKVLVVFNKLHWFIAFIDLLEHSVLSGVIAFLGKHGRSLH